VKAVLLIAANFLREHRWPVIILFAWIVLTALAAGGFGRNRVVADDVVFYVQQQAVYICVFSAFLAAGAIHNERKSRRILLVLSKAISRGQYLLAVILGTWAVSFAYALLFGLCGVWLTARATLPSGGVWSIATLVIAGSLIAATVAMFFSTFLNPYVATALALGLFCAPGMLHAQRHSWFLLLPGLPILLEVVRFNLRSEWGVNWIVIGIAILQSAFFWLIAAAVFDRRDIAVPVE
jgi:ABC-type transport system involved in multi-copper enzyme maturation permease subunit